MDSPDKIMDNLTKFCNEIDYNDPRNTNLEEIELDTNIKEFVININNKNNITIQW